MKNIIDNLISKLKEIDGFIAVSITDIESGESYNSFSILKSFDPELAAAYNLEVVKAKLKAIDVLGLENTIEDITITLSSQVHIINISKSKSFFIYLAVDSNKSNLGITKNLLRKYGIELNEKL